VHEPGIHFELQPFFDTLSQMGEAFFCACIFIFFLLAVLLLLVVFFCKFEDLVGCHESKDLPADITGPDDLLELFFLLFLKHPLKGVILIPS